MRFQVIRADALPDTPCRHDYETLRVKQYGIVREHCAQCGKRLREWLDE